VALLSGSYGWIPALLGLIGALFLFYGSVLLIFEARLALSTTYAEMDFLWRLGKHYAPAELVEQQQTQHRLKFRRHNQQQATEDES
jgi:hypothetical protein